MAIQLILVLLLLTQAGAQGADDPSKWAAREAHEGFLIAADPYTDAARLKAKFGKKHPLEGGLLAVEVFFKNDGDQAVQIGLDDVRLLIHAPGGKRQQIVMLTLEETVERIVNKEKGGPNPTVSRSPLPKGPTFGRSKDWKKVEEVVKPLALEMDIIPPRASVRGFIFFDLGGQMELAEYSKLYVPNVKRLPAGKALLFFEVELGKRQ